MCLNFQGTTCHLGTDHAAIANSCSSQQTCEINSQHNWSHLRKKILDWMVNGHMYLLVIMTEASLWLHTLHILTASNHPTAREGKKGKKSQPAPASHSGATPAAAASRSSSSSSRSTRPRSASLASLEECTIKLLVLSYWMVVPL